MREVKCSWCGAALMLPQNNVKAVGWGRDAPIHHHVVMFKLVVESYGKYQASTGGHTSLANSPWLFSSNSGDMLSGSGTKMSFVLPKKQSRAGWWFSLLKSYKCARLTRRPGGLGEADRERRSHGMPCSSCLFWFFWVCYFAFSKLPKKKKSQFFFFFLMIITRWNPSAQPRDGNNFARRRSQFSRWQRRFKSSRRSTWR